MDPQSTQPFPSELSDVQIESSIKEEQLPAEQISPEDVHQLYQQFRRATLESQARALQKQGQSHVDSYVEPETLADAPKSSAIDPNRFDPYLNSIPQVEFLRFRFHRMAQEKAVETLFALTKTSRAYRVYFANAHTIEVASRSPELSQALLRCNLLLADGSGVLLGSRLTGTPLVHNLNGTDLIPALCQSADPSQKLSVYFLGAKPGVAQQAASSLAKRYPGLHIAGVQDGYFSKEGLATVLRDIRDSKPDILLVAMGTPMQEIWIDRHASQLPGIVCIAVGGLFDFMAGRVPRAPGVFRSLGAEWVWRLLMEPSRLWKRYTIGNLIYLRVLAKSWFEELLSKKAAAQKPNH